MKHFKTIFLSLVSMLILVACNAQTPAFPGAEGGGAFCTGGRGGRVIYVDNLNDKGNGSLRKAIEAKGPRIIIFRVSGNIELSKPIYIKNDSITIAGQTAPGDGICLKNYGLKVEADNVIIRYIRVRPGDVMKEENDAASGSGHKNIIIDHCSFSWAMDEVASFYDNENFTMQWCIVSESLYLSEHHKGEHGYGGIWGGLNASFHHNLLSDHTSRNPRLCGSRYTGKPEREKTDIRNNVIYNWGFNSIYGGEEGYYNIVDNYFKPGPATRKKVRDRILELTEEFYNPSINKDTLAAGKFYICGNELEGFPEISRDNWKGGVQNDDLTDTQILASRLGSPVEHTPVKTEKARQAYLDVLESAGASLTRDPVDLRIIREVSTGEEQYGASYEGGKNGIIDSQNDVGGWPELKSLPAPPDSDNDGMPDQWETKHKLDPGKDDSREYTLYRHYTNVEVYINGLVADKK
ncbi:MAG: pectate lyase family protein [Bacteroidota bacterium]